MFSIVDLRSPAPCFFAFEAIDARGFMHLGGQKEMTVGASDALGYLNGTVHSDETLAG